jgi:ABC-2 type transport system permease protein
MGEMSQLAFGNSLQDILLPLGILLLFAAVLPAVGMFFLQPNRVSN